MRSNALTKSFSHLSFILINNLSGCLLLLLLMRTLRSSVRLCVLSSFISAVHTFGWQVLAEALLGFIDADRNGKIDGGELKVCERIFWSRLEFADTLCYSEGRSKTLA